ncbi:hypothetical protein [Salipiger mucosus]|uniref:Uncharacterized protein n=1 Tax=Salipiger mucosus DSM 16094 TaxID=1123237 RepID=S9R0D3_9RHOB|nr:hypothetical protein [Salipiger mucosus]EPX85332.1 hypothetical protein Salmuc_02711 [Salipiger mucosus DSM 16094]
MTETRNKMALRAVICALLPLALLACVAKDPGGEGNVLADVAVAEAEG